MYIIDDQDNITLTRGNTFEAYVTMKDNAGNYYTPVATDLIVFGVKDPADPDTPLLTKAVPYNTQLVKLASGDTSSLDIGAYIYDVTITHGDGTVDTFIGPHQFTLILEAH